MIGPTLALAAALAAFADPAPAPNSVRDKLLIEFGWDEPDTAFLRNHPEALARTPFDGCVFHAAAKRGANPPENFTWAFWGKTAFTDADLTGAFDDLRAARTGRFRHNFLRVNTAPAEIDWFDDFAPVIANARVAARLARVGPCRGILLDVEQYQGQLFHYAKQRDAKRRTWEDYSAQTRRRGFELMSAFQGEYPGLTVLLTFGPSLVERQMRRANLTAKETEYGLLGPFLEGMAAAIEANPGATLIDGHEISYGYREPAQFDEARATIRRLTPTLKVGFGLWLDYDWRAKGWELNDPSKNHFSPDGFERASRAALERSDEIVWVYTETPRWWSPDGGPAVKLPNAYVESLRRARRP